MDMIIMALPVFALLVVAEVLYTRSQGRNAYALQDFAGSMSQLGINSLVRLAIGGALIGLHFFLYQFRVFEVPNTAWGWVLTFVVIDFVFYWYHRAQHRVRFMWCAHVVHHSSEHMNLGTALRQSPTGPFTRALFYWPLPLLGFHPLMVASAGAVATIYAFFTHTEVVKKLWAPLEWCLVTPSHHRAHHGSNPEYVDRNYGNVFIVGIGCLAPLSPRSRRYATGCSPISIPTTLCGLPSPSGCDYSRILFGRGLSGSWGSCGSVRPAVSRCSIRISRRPAARRSTPRSIPRAWVA